jgi:hypothetical protein
MPSGIIDLPPYHYGMVLQKKPRAKQGDCSMGKKFLWVAVAIWLGVLTVVVSSCAANRADLVKSGVLTIEERAEGKVHIAWSDAYEQAGGLLISGVLMRRDHVGTPIKAHVDATIMSPDGRTLDTACSKTGYVPRRITGRGQSLKRFNIRLPRVPPQGSSVHLVCHSDPAT